ncbi:hypothetical protein PFLUV_G00238830 [Perca fluviatilis]|uniref:Fatty acid hydroxylase domain-containing protein n=1 Tax=Perca fluviatilis TaxID=8168 RepID=A0A6A5E2X6_PERFL|nr:cholesterol 25-hydroxylase-like protein [Perca fluviatilis]KAF1373435.1 hypothetical protein PFLUV_G00238830 [Perca fluviatilis]
MLLQPVWSFLLGHSSVLTSPVFPVIFSLGVYLSLCAPYLLLDVLSVRCAWLRRYKLQPHAAADWASLRRCVALTLYNHLIYIFPLTLLHWYVAPARLGPAAPVAVAVAPAVSGVLVQLLACLLLFDFQSFVWHLLHHRVPWLYRHFHKVHHTFPSPSALTTEHSSAWETLSLGFFAAVTPLVLGVHPLSELCFYVVNMYLSVEDHCGYALPWATHRLVPLGLYGGAKHHDLHHLKSTVNFAPYFTHWDRLAGTLCTQD